MSDRNASFIDLCVSGNALPDEIDIYIDQWHDVDTDLSLHEWLGLSWDEFSAVTANKKILTHIITARRNGKDYLDEYERALKLPIAARTDQIEDAIKLIKKLRQMKNEHS